jgi:hypothetical protein
VISGFNSDVDDVRCFRILLCVQIAPAGYSETSVRNYNCTLRNILEEPSLQGDSYYQGESTVRSEVRCALRLRYVDLVISIEVAVEVCCCFTVFSC